MIEYTTGRGVTIQIRAIPFMLDQIRKTHRERVPQPPVIVEHLAGGATQERTITPRMAEAMKELRPDDWAQYADAWAAYEEKRDGASQALEDAIWMAVALEAIQVDLPEDDAWAKRQKKLYGMEPPDDPELCRVHYIRTEVLGGTRDYIKITSIANGGDIDEEALAIAEDSFRRYLQGTLADGIARGREPAAVEAGAPDGTGAGGEAVGQDVD